LDSGFGSWGVVFMCHSRRRTRWLGYHAAVFQLYHGHRNLAWTYLKNMPGWLFWLYLPHHLILNIWSLITFSLRGQGGSLWRAKRDAVKDFGRFWTKRRQIQMRRVAAPGDLRRVMRGGLIRKPCRN
jgi:hypothetical protein